ncbi:MAG: 7-cyano-7-deazaguanine synthase QueC [Acidobacteria bacterium]|nr:7-cyano-7-deazaguanine synthase QueC [Acidobacteriota bacterium]
MKDLAIVLVSGGMDSCVTAAIAAEQHELALLHVTYGQRTAARERKAFDDIADFYHVQKRLVADISHLRAIGGSALTDERIPVPTAPDRESWIVNRGSSHESRITNHESRITAIPVTYVPFRNTHLLAIAVSWAEVLRAQRIFIGAVAEDSSGYPDCRPEYYQAFNRLIEVGTKPETHIEVITPIIHLPKSAIVQKGLALGAPLHLSWSCYQAEEEACGECESCALRMRAFRQAGVIDPIPYATFVDWGVAAQTLGRRWEFEI